MMLPADQWRRAKASVSVCMFAFAWWIRGLGLGPWLGCRIGGRSGGRGERSQTVLVGTLLCFLVSTCCAVSFVAASTTESQKIVGEFADPSSQPPTGRFIFGSAPSSGSGSANEVEAVPFGRGGQIAADAYTSGECLAVETSETLGMVLNAGGLSRKIGVVTITRERSPLPSITRYRLNCTLDSAGAEKLGEALDIREFQIGRAHV